MRLSNDELIFTWLSNFIKLNCNACWHNALESTSSVKKKNMTELKFAFFFFPLSFTSYLFAIARAVRHREAVAAVTWSFLHLLRPVVRKDILQWVSRSFSSWPHTSTSDGKSLQSALSLRPSWSQKVAVSQIETKNEDEDWIHLTQRKKCQRQLPTPTVSTATAADGISSSSISRTNEWAAAGRPDGRMVEQKNDERTVGHPTQLNRTTQPNTTTRVAMATTVTTTTTTISRAACRFGETARH